MTACKIIEQLYKSDQLNECIRKLIPLQHREDFKQELILTLLSKDAKLIKKLHKEQSLLFFTVNIIIKYRNNKRWYIVSEGTELFDIAEPQETDTETEQRMIKEIKELDTKFNTPFFGLLIKAVDKHGSLREVSRQTGIDVSVLSRSMQKIRQHIKQAK